MYRRISLILTTVAAAACAPAMVQTPRGLDEGQLRATLFAFADDSMQGRRAGTEGGIRAARFLAERLARAGLEPAGDDGTFYQHVPLVRVRVSGASTLSVGGQQLTWESDFMPAPPRWRTRAVHDGRTVYLGTGAADTTGWPSREQLRGRVVVFDRRGQPNVIPGTAPARYLADVAATLVVADLASLPAFVRGGTTTLSAASLPAAMPADPPLVYVSQRVAELALGPLRAAAIGHSGAAVNLAVRTTEEPLPTYNVVAMLRGSDPVLRDEYVAIGAHPDHVGIAPSPLDHDSLRAVLLAANARSLEIGRRLTAAERATLALDADAVVRTGRSRADSVFNGADDNASGSTAVLALAESWARSGVRPRRSIIFVWYHAEELGLLGSRHFTDNPPVPREQIVAAINMDMVGRGRAEDVAGGGPDYVQIVGSRRLSTELGDLVEATNRALSEPLRFDYAWDAPGHPERIYCRSDHANYARYGIPIVFFTTGLHADYHQLTDEPQYIDYAKLRRVATLAGAVTLAVANADRRPRVDGPVGDPFAPCVQ